MNISKAQVEKILKTLPIGYYLNYNVNVELTDDKMSSHNALTDDIRISFPQLRQIFNNTDENSVEIETFVRTMLYHEIGHAILTPIYCYGDTIMNIFEDERLETLLENYFLNVKFKKMIKLAANYNPSSKPTTPMQMFFEVVRFRKGPLHFVNTVAKIIQRYSTTTKRFYEYQYTIDVYALYRDIESYMNPNKANSSQSQSQSQNVFARSKVNKNDIDSKGYTDGSVEAQSNNNILQHNVQASFKSELGYADNDYILEQINQIFASFKTTSTRLGNAIQARSGVFNARSVVRDDYKWWVQKNRQGSIKAFAKLKLNLFIDCSGSFSSNDKLVNCMLKTLIKLEKINPDFQFDLIRCGAGEKLCPKHERIQKSNSGTQISQKIEVLYHQVQQRGWKNINICLYDGDFCLDETKMKAKIRCAKPISVFNNKDSICIFDEENQIYADTYLKNCKVIISKCYTTELIKNVMNALQNLCNI